MMDQTVSFDFFIRLVREYWRAIVSFTVVGLIVAAGLTFFVITPKYQSSVQILVNRKNTNAATEYAGQQADVQMITTYKELIAGQVVLKPTQQQLSERYGIERSLNTLKSEVSVTSTTNSQVFSIAVTDTDAKASATIANQIARSFKNQVQKIIKVNNVTIVAPAETPNGAVSPKKPLNMLIGLVVGLLLGFVYAAIRMLTDRRVHDADFLTDDLGLTSLGFVNHQNQYSIKKQASNLTVAHPTHDNQKTSQTMKRV
ncbi:MULTISPECIES: YveK family protein [Lactiplantibacillus]|uniref:Capsular polysaccharide biosynthesis protein CpsC n=2 Tax=Lactiplantibacillus TaxID=2767842 RepID=A0AAW8WIW2_LACPE|nr:MULTISPECIES: Wzz/FepE/Etk N-terminal domain-containing protein [Lactiplantibacillus]MBU7553927.1 polysaccharide biosynthesis protein [Lactiplantibacillus pentosus]MDT7040478.1 GNVR domain-containing protein [Lactiplantibacillus pentosus]